LKKWFASAYPTISSMQLLAEHAFHLKKAQVAKYNSKVRATPALVPEVGQRKVCTIKVPYPGTSSSDLLSWMVRRNACGQLITFMSLPYPLCRFWLLHSLSGGACMPKWCPGDRHSGYATEVCLLFSISVTILI